MNFVWIVIGVVYVIYKLQQEEKIFSAKSAAIVCAVIAWIFVPWIICMLLFDNKVADIVSAVTFGFPMFGLSIYAIICNRLSERSSKKYTQRVYEETEKDRARQAELSRMSDEELGQLLGISLNDVPFDNKGVYAGSTSKQRRRSYAIALIMEGEGLKYQPNQILETNGVKAFREFLQHHNE